MQLGHSRGDDQHVDALAVVLHAQGQRVLGRATLNLRGKGRAVHRAGYRNIVQTRLAADVVTVRAHAHTGRAGIADELIHVYRRIAVVAAV